jgi:DNA-binding IclR family transcriptional regulator
MHPFFLDNLDKVDTTYDIKVSSEIGMHLPLLAGAGGKALLFKFENLVLWASGS